MDDSVTFHIIPTKIGLISATLLCIPFYFCFSITIFLNVYFLKYHFCLLLFLLLSFKFCYFIGFLGINTVSVVCTTYTSLCPVFLCALVVAVLGVERRASWMISHALVLNYTSSYLCTFPTIKYLYVLNAHKHRVFYFHFKLSFTYDERKTLVWYWSSLSTWIQVPILSLFIHIWTFLTFPIRQDRWSRILSIFCLHWNILPFP